MSAAVPMGFVIVAGIGVFLLTVLAVLILAYTVDASRSARSTAQSVRHLVALGSFPETSPQLSCDGSGPHDTNLRVSGPQRSNQEP